MSEDRKTATEARRDRSIEAYQKELRFRYLVDHFVHDTMQRHKIQDTMTYEPRDLHDLLTDVASQVLKGVYEGDAELGALVQERDAYKAKTLEFAALMPPRPIITKASDEDGTTGRT